MLQPRVIVLEDDAELGLGVRTRLLLAVVSAVAVALGLSVLHYVADGDSLRGC